MAIHRELPTDPPAEEVWCLMERHAGITRPLRVYTSRAAAWAALKQHQDETDGRHWYHIDRALMEDVA